MKWALKGFTVKFIIFLILLFVTPAFAQTYLWRYLSSADCSAETSGKTRDLCVETADDSLWKCIPTAGDCDTAAEWHLVGVSISTALEDTADLLYDADVNTFAELDTLIADKSLVNLEDAATITGDWVNTANPWADNEVVDTITLTNLSQVSDSTEAVQDISGGMFTGNTETNITVTYQDGDGTVDVELDSTATLDTEWDTLAEINAASTDTDAVLDTDIGSTVQAWDAELDTIAALTETNGNVMFVAGGAWTSDATPAINCTDCTNIPAGSVAYDDINDPDGVSGLNFAGFTNTWTSTIGDNNFFVIDTSTTTDFIVQGDGDVTIGGARLQLGDADSYWDLGVAVANSNIIAFDAFDYLEYDRADNSFRFHIGAAPNPQVEITEGLMRNHSESTVTARGISHSQHNDGTEGARVRGRKSRGTLASPTTVVTGDNLARFVADGYDGSNYLEMGAVEIQSTGTIAATRVPTEISLYTATDAAPSVLTERLKIGASGILTQTADSTGTAQTVLPVGAIDTNEILDDTVGLVDIAHTITLAGNPALAISQCHPGANGIICEGTTADDFEALLSVPVTASDKTITFQDATHTVIGKDTTDILTNKTYDTAGAGNSFSINSVAVTANTGTGAVARATSPTFVTPALGTPASGVATNITALNATQLTTGTVPVARVGAAHIDAITEIAAGLKDGVGACSSGLLCLGDHTHAIDSEVSGLGANVATFLGTPTTANFAGAVTGETGTGAVVFGTSPTITTSIDLPAGAINTATEIADDIITHAQILDADQMNTVCITLEYPTDADDILWYRFNEAATVTGMDCIVEDGTSAVVVLVECDSAGDNCGTSRFTESVTCDTDGATDDGVAETGIVAGAWIRAQVGTVTGSTHVSACLSYTYDD